MRASMSAAAQAPPLRTDERHDAQRRVRRAFARAGDDGQRPGRRRCGRRRRFRQIGPLDPQQGDVGRRIAADDAEPGSSAVMGDDRELALVGERVLGRDDEAWTPGKAARSRAAGLDGDEARRDVADETGELGRQGEQERKRRIGLTWGSSFAA